jgi:hypothetical protein
MIVLIVWNVIRHYSDVFVKSLNTAFAGLGKCQSHRVSVPLCKVVLSLICDFWGVTIASMIHHPGILSFVRNPHMPQAHIPN